MLEDFSYCPCISWIWSISDLEWCDKWKNGVDRESKTMKWWEKTKKSLIFLERYQLECSLNICEDILMGEEDRFW